MIVGRLGKLIGVEVCRTSSTSLLVSPKSLSIWACVYETDQGLIPELQLLRLVSRGRWLGEADALMFGIHGCCCLEKSRRDREGRAAQ